MNIIENKTCNTCNKEKCISEFRIIDFTPVNTCKDCQKDKRRKRSGETYVDGKYIPSKVCSICNQEKLRTEDNFTFIDKKGGFRKYNKACKECMKDYISPTPRKTNRNSPPEEDKNKTKICKRCNGEYNLHNFYYSWNNRVNKCYYSSLCKECDNTKKKEDIASLIGEERENYLRKAKEYYKDNNSVNLLRQYHKFDYERKLNNDLTIELISEGLKQPCNYCGFPSTGLDRINNKLGHTQDNCVPCCSECNTARIHNFSHEEMLVIGEAIQYVKRQRQGENPITSLINNLIPVKG